MDILNAITDNLLTPAILFFLLGVLAGVFKSDLEIPQSISRYLAIYLMMAIGFKGGAAFAQTPEFGFEVITTVVAGLAFGFLQPFVSYALLVRTTGIDRPTAAAVAAHYGSISMVTFATAAAFLGTEGIAYAGYIVGILALKEAPAIVTGLFIAHRAAPQTRHVSEDHRLMREIFTNGAILLLVGAFVIGWLTGDEGMAKMEGFLVTPFQGILALFLLDMGLLVSRNAAQLKSFTPPLVAFAIYMPLASAAVGLGLAYLIGLDQGTGFLFMVLCASASYIAVPAAMRLSLPEANAAIYLPMSLAVTFPFNVILGIPLYFAAAGWLTG
jgi:uncharacterized protein